MKFENLKGKILTNIEIKHLAGDYHDGDVIEFTDNEGHQYQLYHDQDCCESVTVDDVCGELDDLIGTPLLLVEESTNSTDDPPNNADSFTWTFYRLATIKGAVTIKWLGESNGYYGEDVDFCKV